jgi:hypothetical protein
MFQLQSENDTLRKKKEEDRLHDQQSHHAYVHDRLCFIKDTDNSYRANKDSLFVDNDEELSDDEQMLDLDAIEELRYVVSESLPTRS